MYGFTATWPKGSRGLGDVLEMSSEADFGVLRLLYSVVDIGFTSVGQNPGKKPGYGIKRAFRRAENGTIMTPLWRAKVVTRCGTGNTL